MPEGPCQRDRFLSRLTNSRKAAFSAPNTENQEVKLIFPALKPAPKPAPIPAHRLKPPLYSWQTAALLIENQYFWVATTALLRCNYGSLALQLRLSCVATTALLRCNWRCRFRCRNRCRFFKCNCLIISVRCRKCRKIGPNTRESMTEG